MQTLKRKADADTFVSSVIDHEGLLPGQTPFRTDNPVMKTWNTIHGYKISKKQRPIGRENFIFLENPKEVSPAVRQQFVNYTLNPARFGLPQNPTIGAAISKFDQTGARGKLDFLRKRGFDPAQPLSSLFQPQTGGLDASA